MITYDKALLAILRGSEAALGAIAHVLDAALMPYGGLEVAIRTLEAAERNPDDDDFMSSVDMDDEIPEGWEPEE